MLLGCKNNEKSDDKMKCRIKMKSLMTFDENLDEIWWQVGWMTWVGFYLFALSRSWATLWIFLWTGLVLVLTIVPYCENCLVIFQRRRRKIKNKLKQKIFLWGGKGKSGQHNNIICRSLLCCLIKFQKFYLPRWFCPVRCVLPSSPSRAVWTRWSSTSGDF